MYHWQIFSILSLCFSFSRCQSDISVCGNRPFDPEKQICCGGVLSQRTNPYTACCGTRSYRLGQQLCCDFNSAYLVNVQTPLQQCCGQYRTYNTLTQKCCKYDTVLELPPDAHFKNYQCCGSNTFDVETHLCCNEKIIAKPSQAYTYDCCGTSGNIYSREQQFCCNGVPRNKPAVQPNAVSCCGTELYNTKIGVCCEQQVFFRPSCWTGCCGKNPYNLDAFLCCSGNLVPRPFFHTDQYACCGSRRYHKGSNLCCQGAIVRQPSEFYDCCGSTRYNKRNQICCGGRLYSRQGGARTLCCGAVAYDGDNSICCGNQVSRRTYGRNTGCCEQRAFNAATEVCCRDKIVYPITYFQAGLNC